MANRRTNLRSETATMWPIIFAAGVATLLAGLIVNVKVVAPLGGAIAVVAVFGWVRSGERPRSREHVDSSRRPPPRNAERYSRGRFLGRATLGLGGLVAAGVAVPAAGLALLSGVRGQRQRRIDLGPVSAFPEGTFVIATFLLDPAEGEVSRRAAFIRNNGSRDGVPSFTAMSSRCTHVGCPTQPNGPVFADKHRSIRTADGDVGIVPTLPAGGFGCPCHGSQFDSEGNRTAGPAARALDRYAFSIRNGHLWLERLFSVSRVEGKGANARIHAFGRRGAGEPVTGPESWLYPIDTAA
ncbi:MAG TPA: Rieske 2Fe-2S domain-containing protein [Gaiellaceae bacterium]